MPQSAAGCGFAVGGAVGKIKAGAEGSFCPDPNSAFLRLYGAVAPPQVRRSLSETEFLDYSTVSLDVLLLKVSEEVASVSDHLEKTAAAVVVLLVGLQVLVESYDPVCEDRDLHLGRAGIALVDSVLFDEFLFLFLCDHCFHLKKIFDSEAQRSAGETLFLALYPKTELPMPW